MKLTEEQKQKLQSFHCERLSANEANFDLINDFYNAKNNSLVDTLQNEAFEDDQNNRIAYYVVKDGDENILFFFSLKCGLLYDEFIEGDRLKEMQSFYAHILQICKDETLSEEDVARALHMPVDSDEFTKVFGKNLKNVGKTFPGVEIVHFCANDEHRHVWTDLHIPMKLGSYIFSTFLVPIVQNLTKLVGCEYQILSDLRF